MFANTQSLVMFYVKIKIKKIKINRFSGIGRLVLQGKLNSVSVFTSPDVFLFCLDGIKSDTQHFSVHLPLYR